MSKPPNFKGYGSDESVVFDASSSSILTEQMLEDAVTSAAANFGSAQQFIFPASMMKQTMSAFYGSPWYPNPEYVGTPWADKVRLTKRERKIARLHKVLKDLGVLKKIDEPSFEEIKDKSVKRLKRAAWAQTGKRKVKSLL